LFVLFICLSISLFLGLAWR